MPGASTTGFKVLSPETKLPSGVFQVNGKVGPVLELLPFSVVCNTVQFKVAAESIMVVGAGAKSSTVLVEVAQMPAPLTVTL